MVRNSEISQTSMFTQDIAGVVRALTQEHGISQTQIAERLNRVQSYVSLRMQGRKAWTTNDLDVLAAMLGMTGMSLLSEVARRSRFDLPEQRH